MSEIDDLRFPVGRSPAIERLTTEERARAIDDIAACPARLRSTLAGLDDAQLDTPYRDGGWTVRQVVHHLADSHMNAYIRHKLAVNEELPTIKPYDQDRWAELADVRECDPQVSLALLEGLHERWVRYLRALAPEQFERRFVHPEMKSHPTLDGSVAMYGWHGRHHTAQIDGLRRRLGWQRAGKSQ